LDKGGENIGKMQGKYDGRKRVKIRCYSSDLQLLYLSPLSEYEAVGKATKIVKGFVTKFKQGFLFGNK
jgi:hypothetical protein